MFLLKQLFGRERPPLADRLIDVDSLSFPSGHAMMSTAIYGLTAAICYRLYAWVRENPLILLIAPALVLVIGMSRVYLGVHWASDVIFGWVLGLLWLGVCLVMHRQIVRWVQART